MRVAHVRPLTGLRFFAALWVMLIGAFGISVGLLLFGPRLIRLVGEEITKLNPMRAYCVALSTAFTVIVASWLGLPVSTTHIAVGSVFGVGFFREWYTANSPRRRRYMERKNALHRATRAQLPQLNPAWMAQWRNDAMARTAPVRRQAARRRFRRCTL